MRPQRFCVLPKSFLSLFLCAPALAQLPNAEPTDPLRLSSDNSALSLPENFDEGQLQGWVSRIARPRLRTLVSRGLEEALAKASQERMTAE